MGIVSSLKTFKLLFVFILLTVFAGCAYRPDQGQNGSGELTIFPHPSNISEGDIHRQVAYASDISYCVACHKETASSMGPKPCTTCHSDIFAHPSDTFADPEEHGPVAIANGPMNICVNCHGSNLTGSEIAPSCYQNGCHQGSPYPHNVPNFNRGSVHGPRTSQSDFPVCLNCHEKATASAKGIAACADCHHNSSRNCLDCHPNNDD